MDHWTVSEALLTYVLENVHPGGTILELGSGDSTRRFISARRNVITVEHDHEWVGKVKGAKYIYAPIKFYGPDYVQLPSIAKKISTHCGWYDPMVLGEALRNQHWDLILVDGPTRAYGRSGFLHHLDLFSQQSRPWHIVFDDLERVDDLWVAARVAAKLGCDLRVTNNGEVRTHQKANGDWQADVKKPFGIVRSA